jgi:hypothetical protein
MRPVALVGGPQDGRIVEVEGGAAIETLTCETLLSGTYEAHRYEFVDPHTARWVKTEVRSW